MFTIGTHGDHVSGNVANTASPSLRRLVKNVVNSETAVLLGKSIQVLLEEDVLRRDVGKDQVNLSLVTSGSSANDSPDDLEHGSDTGTAGNHTKVAHHVGGVDESALGALDLDVLANGKGGQVLRDVTSRVRLDQEINVARLVVTRDGSVGSNNLLGGAIGLLASSTNRNVLANWQAKDGGRRGEVEAVAVKNWLVESSCVRVVSYVHGGVVGENGLLLEIEVLEGIGLEEDLGHCSRVSRLTWL
jgi:hypothetical protein